MDLSTEDIANKYGLAACWPQVDAALKEYGAQEAKSYASWIANQPIQGRTYHKLWLDYEAEVLSQVPARPEKLRAAPSIEGVAAAPSVGGQDWVIVCMVKGRGLPYWRPNGAGYTESITDAGKYTYAEADATVQACKGDAEAYVIGDPTLYKLISNENLARGKEIKLWLEVATLRETLDGYKQDGVGTQPWGEEPWQQYIERQQEKGRALHNRISVLEDEIERNTNDLLAEVGPLNYHPDFEATQLDNIVREAVKRLSAAAPAVGGVPAASQINIQQQARDLHYQLIEQFGLVDNGPANSKVRSLLVEALRAAAPASVASIGGEAAQNGWISVNERLPEPARTDADYSVRVLAFGDGGIDGPHFVAYCSLDGDGKWYLAHDNQPTMKVTHWQTLAVAPQAPATDENR